MDENPKDYRLQEQSPDVCAAQIFAVVFGIFLYASWALDLYHKLDGLFIKDTTLLGGDFFNYWSAARLAFQNHIMVLFNLDDYHAAQEALLGHTLSHLYNWSYPPSLIPCLLWLGLFPYPVALVLWIGATFAGYAFAVAYKRPTPWALTFMLALAPASYMNVTTGQNGFLSAALLIGGLRLLSARPALAGILFGLLTFKPQLGLLVPVALLVAKKWRTITVAALTTLVLVGISILLFGLEPWQAYLTAVPHFQQIILEADPASQVNGATTLTMKMMPSLFVSLRILGAALPIAYAGAALMAVASVLAVIYAFGRSKSPDYRNPVLLTAVFLTSPYVFSYDMPILTAGIVGTVAALGPRIKTGHVIICLAAWTLPVFVTSLNNAGVPLSPVVTAALLATQLFLIYTPRDKALVDADTGTDNLRPHFAFEFPEIGGE